MYVVLETYATKFKKKKFRKNTVMLFSCKINYNYAEIHVILLPLSFFSSSTNKKQGRKREKTVMSIKNT